MSKENKTFFTNVKTSLSDLIKNDSTALKTCGEGMQKLQIPESEKPYYINYKENHGVSPRLKPNEVKDEVFSETVKPPSFNTEESPYEFYESTLSNIDTNNNKIRIENLSNSDTANCYSPRDNPSSIFYQSKSSTNLDDRLEVLIEMIENLDKTPFKTKPAACEGKKPIINNINLDDLNNEIPIYSRVNYLGLVDEVYGEDGEMGIVVNNH